MDTLHLGIIGLGRIAKVHITNILQSLPQFNIVSVADPQLDDMWLQANGGIQGFQDPMAVIRDPKVQAILICSPVATHVPLIMEAAKHGKGIFCEKPLSLDEAEIHQAMRAVQDAKVPLQMGFNRRFDHNFAELQQSVASGKVGKPYMVRITSRDPGLPSLDYLKSSGGMFMDMTIHDFDMARFLVGSEVEEVFATGSCMVAPEVKAIGDIDTAVIHLKFKNGVLGVIENCRHADYGYDQRCEVLGSKGAVFADNCKATSVIHRSQQGQSQEPPLHFFLERYNQAYLSELEAFFDCMINHEAPQVSGFDALMALKLAQGAKQSMLDKKTVMLSEIE